MFSQRVREEQHIYKASNDSINKNQALILQTYPDNIEKREAINIQDRIRVDSLSGWPRFIFTKYISVDGRNYYTYFADTIEYGDDIWDTTYVKLNYIELEYEFNDLLITRYKNEIRLVDSTQANKVLSESMWEYTK